MMKTIEQQADEYADLVEPPILDFTISEFQNGFDNGLHEGSKLGFKAGYKAATRWIPVEDRNVRMPDLKECLLLDENGKVWTDDEFTEKRPMVIITHWFPIPPILKK